MDLACVIFYWWSMMVMHLSRTVIEIRSVKDIGVSSLTFWGRVTSSVTWPLDPFIPNTLPQNQTRTKSDARLLRCIHLKMPISGRHIHRSYVSPMGHIRWAVIMAMISWRVASQQLRRRNWETKPAIRAHWEPLKFSMTCREPNVLSQALKALWTCHTERSFQRFFTLCYTAFVFLAAWNNVKIQFFERHMR